MAGCASTCYVGLAARSVQGDAAGWATEACGKACACCTLFRPFINAQDIKEHRVQHLRQARDRYEARSVRVGLKPQAPAPQA